MTYIEERQFHAIPGLTTQTYDYIIPNGSVLTLSEMGASSVSGTNTLCKIIWDPDGENKIIMAEYASAVQKTISQFTGDGVKKLRISLSNANTLNTETMGVYWMGVIND